MLIILIIVTIHTLSTGLLLVYPTGPDSLTLKPVNQTWRDVCTHTNKNLSSIQIAYIYLFMMYVCI